MKFLGIQFGGRVEKPLVDPTKGTPTAVVIALNTDDRTHQRDKIIHAVTGIVGEVSKNVKEFPYVQHRPHEFGQRYYPTEAEVYDAKGGNLMARIGLHEPTNLIWVQLREDLTPSYTSLMEKLKSEGIQNPDVLYGAQSSFLGLEGKF